MATLLGKGEIFGMSGGALGIASLSGYVSPNLKTLRLGHNNTADEIKGQDGEISALIFSGDYIECTFDFIPQGTTVANAKKAAGVPASGAGVTVTGLPIIAFGPFSDALNTDSGNTQPWIYFGGGSISGESEQKWTATLPLRRYIGITSATAIT